MRSHFYFVSIVASCLFLISQLLLTYYLKISPWAIHQPTKRPLGSREENLNSVRHMTAHCDSLLGMAKIGSEIKVSAYFTSSLRSYEIIHKRCISSIHSTLKNVGSYTDLIHCENCLQGCRFLVLQEIYAGIGNRILGLVSAFAYSLLTNRVLLISDENNLGQILCSPFPFSDWKLGVGVPLDNLTFEPHMQQLWDGFQQGKKYNAIHLQLMDWFGPSEQWFFTDEGQKAIKEVQWLSFQSNQYIVPSLFLNPTMALSLKRLFPNNQIMSALSRYLVLPSNEIWRRVNESYNNYFKNSSFVLGLQIRTFSSYKNETNKRIEECLDKLPILPTGRFGNSSNSTFGSKKNDKVTIFVASLYGGYSQHLTRLFSKRRGVRGGTVEVVQLSQERVELHNLEHMKTALVELWLLSLSSRIVISFMSTFGYVAAGLSGNSPVLLNVISRHDWQQADFRTNGKPICEFTLSPEPCQLSAPKFLDCQNVKVHKDFVFNVTECDRPLVQCQDFDGGITLN